MDDEQAARDSRRYYGRILELQRRTIEGMRKASVRVRRLVREANRRMRKGEVRNRRVRDFVTAELRQALGRYDGALLADEATVAEVARQVERMAQRWVGPGEPPIRVVATGVDPGSRTLTVTVAQGRAPSAVALGVAATADGAAPGHIITQAPGRCAGDEPSAGRRGRGHLRP